MVTKGRFAPTPSGPLHEGSLQTAVASWLSARGQSGAWMLRIDDLDTLRCPPGVTDQILRQLEAYALTWDGQPMLQSAHLAVYEQAQQQLAALGALYPCDCTRAAVRSRMAGREGSYDQHCWTQPHSFARQPAIRLALDDDLLPWHDQCLGPQQPSRRALGDPVVWRRDGVPGYALACAVDEWTMGITEVVRGADLVSETAAQVQVTRLLKQPLPQYRHTPLVMDDSGRKMSKQNHAAALPMKAAEMSAVMLRTLGRLGQPAPAMLQGASPSEILEWALAAGVHTTG